MSSSSAQACVALLLCLCVHLAQPCFAHPFTPLGTFKNAARRAAGLTDQRDLVSRCTEKRHNTTLDHYGWVRTLSLSEPILPDLCIKRIDSQASVEV